MAQDEITNAPLGIAMSVVVRLVPSNLSKTIVDVRKDVMLDAVVPRNLVGPDPVKELALLADDEPIEVDPRAVDAGEGGVEVLLVILGTLDERHVWELGECLGLVRGRVSGQDADMVAAAFGECCEAWSVKSPVEFSG